MTRISEENKEKIFNNVKLLLEHSYVDTETLEKNVFRCYRTATDQLVGVSRAPDWLLKRVILSGFSLRKQRDNSALTIYNMLYKPWKRRRK